MIRSIAYELFDRLTTDPDALRKQVAEAQAGRSAAIAELHDCRYGYAVNATNEEFARVTADRNTALTKLAQAIGERDAVQLQFNELLAQLPEGMKHCTILYEECPVGHGHLRGGNWEKHECFICDAQASKHKLAEAELEIARLQKAYASFRGTDLTIEPTWILAAWNVSGSEWAEVKRGSYDAMSADMRRNATPWNLFPRSAWDALVKNGRAR